MLEGNLLTAVKLIEDVERIDRAMGVIESWVGPGTWLVPSATHLKSRLKVNRDALVSAVFSVADKPKETDIAGF